MPVKITKVLEENVKNYEELFSDCADIKNRRIWVGQHLKKECFISYIEVSVSSTDWQASSIGKLLNTLRTLPEEELASYVEENTWEIGRAHV